MDRNVQECIVVWSFLFQAFYVYFFKQSAWSFTNEESPLYNSSLEFHSRTLGLWDCAHYNSLSRILPKNCWVQKNDCECLYNVDTKSKHKWLRIKNSSSSSDKDILRLVFDVEKGERERSRFVTTLKKGGRKRKKL